MLTPPQAGTLAAWYDFSDATTLFTDTGRTTPVSADGQQIRGVTDKSGTSEHVSDANGCVYKVNIQNGKSVSRYPGFLSGSLTLGQPMTVVVVGKYAAQAPFQRFCDGTTGRVLIGAQGNNTAILYAGIEDAALKPIFFGGTWGIFVGHVNSTSSKLWINGGASSNGNAGTATLDGHTVGSSSGGSEGLTGDIGELFYYSGLVSIANINGVGNHLAAKWGITWSNAT